MISYSVISKQAGRHAEGKAVRIAHLVERLPLDDARVITPAINKRLGVLKVVPGLGGELAAVA